MISNDCEFEPGSRGQIVSDEPNDPKYDYVIRLDKYRGDLYEFRQREIEKATSCENHKKSVFSTEREKWVCPFCEL